MLNSGKKNSRLARQKKKYSNSRVVRKNFFKKQKNILPPPPQPLQAKWSVPNTQIHDCSLS